MERFAGANKKEFINPVKNNLGKTVSVSTGGTINFSDKEIKNFITGTILYLNTSSNIDLDYLPEPKTKNDPEMVLNKKMSQKSMSKKSMSDKSLKPDFNYNLKDISGVEKAHERLVFIISINGKEYVLKIALSQPYFVKEIDIYKELTKAMQTDTQLEDKIIKIYGGSELNKGDKYEILVNDQKILFDKNNNANLFQKINNLFENKDLNSIVYSVLDFNNNYMTLKTALNDNLIKDKCILLLNVLNTLNFLNKKYGFIHFDLHPENLLINVNEKENSNYETNKFKLFDFDLSWTKKNKNREPIVRGLIYQINKVDPEALSEDDFAKLGFIYDFYRFIDRYNVLQLSCQQDKINQLLDIYKKYPLDPEAYENFQDYFFYLGEKITILYKNKEYDHIQNILNEVALQTAGNYMYKYMKYKQKYLELKNKTL